MKKLKTTALLLAITLMLSLFTACNSGAKTPAATTTPAPTTAATATPEATPAKITLTFQNFNASGKEDVLQKMIDAYTKEHPNVTIQVQTVGYDGYFDQLQTQVSGGKAADIFELNLENFPSYAEDGAILDLSSNITATDKTTYAGKSLEAFTYDGKQYGLPNSFSTCLLFYNQDLFDKAGVAYPDKNWTWADVDKAAEKISEIDGVWGYYQPVTYNELYKAVAQDGGSIVSADGKTFQMTSTAVIDTVTRMTNMVAKDWMPSADEMGAMGDWDMFQAGKLGMIISGMWAFDTFTKGCNFKWNVAVEPGATKGTTATHFFSNAYCLNADIDESKVETAVDFIRFITTSSTCADLRIAAGWDLPPISDQASLSTYLEIPTPANRQAVFDSLNYAVVPTITPNYSQLQDIIATYLGDILDGSMTVDEAMKQCQADLTTNIKLS